jgi:hypothetical protein
MIRIGQPGYGFDDGAHLEGLMLIREGSRNWIWKQRFMHMLVTKTYDHILLGFIKVRRLCGTQRVEVDVGMMPFNKNFNWQSTWFSLWEHVPI